MTHLISRRWIAATVILHAVLISACLPRNAVSTPAVTPAGSPPTVAPATNLTAVTAAASSPTTAPAVATPTATDGALKVAVVFGPGSFILTETTAGLAVLSSYKATLTLSFAGTRNGKSQQWSKTYMMLAAMKPAARQLTIVTTGDLSDLTPVFMAELDGTAYARRGKNACTAVVIDSANSLAKLDEPAGFLTGVIGAVEAGSETVNAAAAKHYTFDERALGQAGLAKSTGEMWVASDGGYIVRYKAVTAGTPVYFGEGVQGTLTWDYELTDANQPVAIQLPKDCPAGIVNAPLLSDATGVLRMPGLLSYSTPSSLAQAAAFYQKQIPLLGYKPLGNPITTDTRALLDYTQGAATMSVIITAGKGATTVRIVMH